MKTALILFLSILIFPQETGQIAQKNKDSIGYKYNKNLDDPLVMMLNVIDKTQPETKEKRALLKALNQNKYKGMMQNPKLGKLIIQDYLKLLELLKEN